MLQLRIARLEFLFAEPGLTVSDGRKAVASDMGGCNDRNVAMKQETKMNAEAIALM
jgi:hypothetical protein